MCIHFTQNLMIMLIQNSDFSAKKTNNKIWTGVILIHSCRCYYSSCALATSKTLLSMQNFNCLLQFCIWHTPSAKLQALVYDILPSTTAIFSYNIGSRKLSANEQFFVGAQTVVSLLQTTQIISDVCL